MNSVFKSKKSSKAARKRKGFNQQQELCVTGQYVQRKSENCKSQDKLHLAKDIKTNTEKFLIHIIKNRSRKEIKYNLDMTPKLN